MVTVSTAVHFSMPVVNTRRLKAMNSVIFTPPPRGRGPTLPTCTVPRTDDGFSPRPPAMEDAVVFKTARAAAASAVARTKRVVPVAAEDTEETSLT